MNAVIYERQRESSFRPFFTTKAINVPSLDPVAAHIVVDITLATGNYCAFKLLDFSPVSEMDIELGPYRLEHLGMSRAIALDLILSELRGRYRKESPQSGVRVTDIEILETNYPETDINAIMSLSSYENFKIYAYVGSRYAFCGIKKNPMSIQRSETRFFCGKPNPLLIHIASAVIIEHLSKYYDEDRPAIYQKYVYMIGPVDSLHVKLIEE